MSNHTKPKFPPVDMLFSKTLTLLKKDYKRIVPVIFVVEGMAILLQVAFYQYSIGQELNPATQLTSPAHYISIALGMLPIITIPLWFFIIIQLLHHSHRTVQEAITHCFSRIGPYIALNIVATLAVLGASFFFFIPGIVLSVFLTFVLSVFVLEQKSPLQAMLHSREYARGHFWQIILNYLIIYFLTVIPYTILYTIVAVQSFGAVKEVTETANSLSQSDMKNLFATTGWIGSVGTFAINVFFTYPLTTVYWYILYTEVKIIKPHVTTKKSTLSYFIIFAIIGFLAIATGLFLYFSYFVPMYTEIMQNV